MKISINYCLILISAVAFSQVNKTVIIVDNYNNWGWDTVLITKNKFISVAIVPAAAGRILEFNLGKVPSLWINPKLFGKSFPPDDKVKIEDWRNFGGYRIVPIPVDNFAVNSQYEKTKRWPPPVVIGDSPYDFDVSNNINGNQVINVSSGIQNLPVPLFDTKTDSFSIPQKIDEQLQYKRSLYIEEGKSLVYIKHTLINSGLNTILRGLKITSQHPGRSQPELTDGDNFLAYFPFDKNFTLDSGKPVEIAVTPQSRWNFINKNRFPLDKNNPEQITKYFNIGTNWTGEVSPGIYGLYFDYNLMGGLRSIASKPWICYVDKLNNTAFVKIFEPYNKALNYEFGANVEIYNSGLETGYLETEVKTPIYELKPNESFDYYEIQAATKIASIPILDVNRTGVITNKLVLNSRTNELSGAYGVFLEGQALLHLKNKSGKIIEEINLGNVNPLAAFTFKTMVEKELKVCTIELYIVVNNNEMLLLDTYLLT